MGGNSTEEEVRRLQKEAQELKRQLYILEGGEDLNEKHYHYNNGQSSSFTSFTSPSPPSSPFPSTFPSFPLLDPIDHEALRDIEDELINPEIIQWNLTQNDCSLIGNMISCDELGRVTSL